MVRAVTAVLALAVLAGCGSTVPGTGRGSGARSTPPGAGTSHAPASSTGVAPTPTSSPTPTPTPAPVPAGITPCPQTDVHAVVGCLRQVLSDFWSGQLNNVIGEAVVLDADPARVP